jgi:hypothetical protein
LKWKEEIVTGCVGQLAPNRSDRDASNVNPTRINKQRQRPYKEFNSITGQRLMLAPIALERYACSGRLSGFEQARTVALH